MVTGFLLAPIGSLIPIPPLESCNPAGGLPLLMLPFTAGIKVRYRPGPAWTGIVKVFGPWCSYNIYAYFKYIWYFRIGLYDRNCWECTGPKVIKPNIPIWSILVKAMATDVAAAWESVADIRRRALKHQLVTFQVSVFVFHIYVCGGTICVFMHVICIIWCGSQIRSIMDKWRESLVRWLTLMKPCWNRWSNSWEPVWGSTPSTSTLRVCIVWWKPVVPEPGLKWRLSFLC